MHLLFIFILFDSFSSLFLFSLHTYSMCTSALLIAYMHTLVFVSTHKLLPCIQINTNTHTLQPSHLHSILPPFLISLFLFFLSVFILCSLLHLMFLHQFTSFVLCLCSYVSLYCICLNKRCYIVNKKYALARTHKSITHTKL